MNGYLIIRLAHLDKLMILVGVSLIPASKIAAHPPRSESPEIDPIELNASQPIPLGLIINEALTNSIKYAFPDSRRGEITVSLAGSGAKYQLELTDNGIGILGKITGKQKTHPGRN